MRHTHLWMIPLMMLACGCSAIKPRSASTGDAQASSSAGEGKWPAPDQSYDTAPKAVMTVRPVYPGEMKRQGRESTVKLEVTVAEDGTDSDVVVYESDGHEFEKAAIDAVRLWQFEPARLGGEPVEATILIPLRFTLNR